MTKMNTSKHTTLRLSAMALAMLGVYGQVLAADDSLAQFLKPSSSVSVGVAGVNGDSANRAIFGQYNGWRKERAEPVLELDFVVRDDGSGSWTMAKIQDLALPGREVSVLKEKQGDWKLSASYAETERDYPRTINTAMTGAGSYTPTVVRLATPGTGASLDLKTTRRATSVGMEKWLSPSLQIEASFKNEDKSGARLWGRGYDCAAYVCGSSTATAINQANFVKNALLMLPEPINTSTQQLDARLNYRTEKLLLSVGYYGSLFNNSYGSMTASVPNSFNNGLGTGALPGYPAVTGAIIAGGGTSLQNVLQLPTALPPDNQAHQLYLDGNYALAARTRMTFKLAYTYASQNDSFAANGLTDAPAGVSGLGAKVNTTLAQLGLTARPTSKLNLLANARYEKKDDRTPQYLYSVEPLSVLPATSPARYTTTGAYWNNALISSTREALKLEAGYRLPADMRATLGADYSSLERDVPTDIREDKVAGLSALRAKNHETTWRAELRRSLSDTLNGGLSYSQTKRSGSDWTSLSQLNPATPGITAANLSLIKQYCGGVACYGQQLPDASILGFSATTAFPLSMVDLDRHKWKLSGDWNPTERFNLQLVLEQGKDRNSEPFNAVVGGKGWRDSKVALYSLDAAYAISDAWKLSAFASHTDQTQDINHSTGYMANLNNIDNAAGLTLTGKLGSKVDAGATLSYLRDVSHYGLDASVTTSGTLPGTLTAVAPSAANLAQVAIGLPDVTYRQLALKLFASYAVQKNADLRVDLIHQRVRFNEWTWQNNNVPFLYADNTTVSMLGDQRVSYLSLRYIYRF
jgi:MtrB/PioB family decaheme-associated outer membrane protein